MPNSKDNLMNLDEIKWNYKLYGMHRLLMAEF